MNGITIRALWDIHHDGRRIAPGTTATLAEDTARALVDGGAAELADASVDTDDAATGDDRRSAILAAIAGLEPGNPDHWTRSGKPEIRALAAASGLTDITASERDAAWQTHQTHGGDT